MARFKAPNIRDTNGYVFLWHETFSNSIRKYAPVSNVTPSLVPEKTPRPVSDLTPKESHGEESQRNESHSSSTELYSSSAPPPPPTPSSRRPRTANEFKRNDDDPPKERQFNGSRDELIMLIQESTGLTPDRRLIRDILEGLELRGIALVEYLVDIFPRLRRLKDRPRPAFFRHHMTAWGDTRPAKLAPLTSPAAQRCVNCSGTGKKADQYCDCAMGRDLQMVETRAARLSEARK